MLTDTCEFLECWGGVSWIVWTGLFRSTVQYTLHILPILKYKSLRDVWSHDHIKKTERIYTLSNSPLPVRTISVSPSRVYLRYANHHYQVPKYIRTRERTLNRANNSNEHHPSTIPVQSTDPQKKSHQQTTRTQPRLSLWRRPRMRSGAE